MSGLVCKRCGGNDLALSGKARGLPRHRCRGCGYHFTDTPPRGKPASMRALAILQYAQGGMSLRMIGRILGVSRTTVQRWIRTEAQSLPTPTNPPGKVTLAVDEMWHFIKKNLQNLALACV